MANAEHTGPAHAVQGSFANSGFIGGDVVLGGTSTRSIDVVVRPHSMKMEVGETAKLSVEVRNRSTRTKTYSLRATGLAPELATFEPAQVTVEPSKTGTVTLTVCCEPTQPAAGRTPIRVQAFDGDSHFEWNQSELVRLTVRPRMGVRLSHECQERLGRSNRYLYRADLINTGNTWLRQPVQVVDHRVQATCDPKDIPPGQQAKLQLVITFDEDEQRFADRSVPFSMEITDEHHSKIVKRVFEIDQAGKRSDITAAIGASMARMWQATPQLAELLRPIKRWGTGRFGVPRIAIICGLVAMFVIGGKAWPHDSPAQIPNQAAPLSSPPASTSTTTAVSSATPSLVADTTLYTPMSCQQGTFIVFITALPASFPESELRAIQHYEQHRAEGLGVSTYDVSVSTWKETCPAAKAYATRTNAATFLWLGPVPSKADGTGLCAALKRTDHDCQVMPAA